MALTNCEECGKMISDKAASCPHCGCPVEHQGQRTPSLFVRWLICFIFILVLMAGIFFIFSDDESSGYGTVQWAQPSNYMFAVGIDSYDGDVFNNGIYTFYQSDVREGTAPAVYDIYTSKTYYSNSHLLKPEDFKGSVGGFENDTLFGSIEGKYVYVIYHGTAASSGILNIQIEPMP